MRFYCPFLVVAILTSLVSQSSGLTMSNGPELPINVVTGFGVIVRGDIGTAHNLNLLVDTGAVPSVLNEHVARKLMDKSVWAEVANACDWHSYGSDHTIRVPYVNVHSIRVGPAFKSKLPMVLVDLRQLGRSLHIRVDAILGMDFFEPQSFSIDYKRKKLVLGLSEHATHTLKAEVTRSVGAPYWIVPIALNNNRIRLLLDTGTDSVTLFSGRALHLLSESRHETTAFTLTGQQALETAQVSALTFGGMQFRHRPVYIRPESPNGLPKLDGLFGPRSLGLTVVAFDWEHQTLNWGTD